jgi:hypothetical protein
MGWSFRTFLILSLALWLGGCRRELGPEEQGAAHLEALRQAGMLDGKRGSTHVLDVRLITPKATRWSSGAPSFWCATLQTDDGEAGFLAWKGDASHALVDFLLEGQLSLDLPGARVLDGVPPVQQFVVRGADGKPVASGCVPTAGASLMAYWSNRGTFDWQADDSHQGLVLRLRDRMAMSVLPDLEGFTDGKMQLAGATSSALVAALKEDAAQYKVKAEVTSSAFTFEALRQEIRAGRPAVLICTVLVPRKPELAWGHAVVAVGFAEVAGEPFIAVIDNFLEARQPGTVRWIAAAQARELVFVRPVR